MRLSTLSIAIAALAASIASANAMPPVRAGILQCQGGQNVGFVVGSVDQPRMRVPERRPPSRTLYRHRAPHRPRSRHHRADPVHLGGECAEHPARPRRSRRQLWRRRRQRLGRHRRWRQFPGRRSRQFLCAAADQRAGPDRAQRRGRHRRPRTAAGPRSAAIATIITAITVTVERKQCDERGPRKRAFFCVRTAFRDQTVRAAPE